MPYGYVLRKFFILLGPLFFPFTQPSSGVIALTNDLTICFQAAVVGTWHQHLPFPVVQLVGKMGMQSQQNHVSFLAVHLLSNCQLSSVLHSSMVVSCWLVSLLALQGHCEPSWVTGLNLSYFPSWAKNLQHLQLPLSWSTGSSLLVVQIRGPAQAPYTEIRSAEICVHGCISPWHGSGTQPYCAPQPQSFVFQAVGIVLAGHRIQWEKAGLEGSKLLGMRQTFLHHLVDYTKESRYFERWLRWPAMKRKGTSSRKESEVADHGHSTEKSKGTCNMSL